MLLFGCVFEPACVIVQGQLQSEGSILGEISPLIGNTVHNLNTGLSYSSIQAAINDVATLAGNTISVDNGVYYEHVEVNKTLTLLGQS